MARAALTPRSRGHAPLAAFRGAAIVMAMLLAAFAATIAVTLLWQQQRWIGEHEHRRDQVQAQALAMAGVQWARQVLNDNVRANAVVHLGQPWALRLPPTPIENGSVSGFMIDAQSKLNVNNLAASGNAASAMQIALRRLFQQIGVPLTLIAAIGDWVDADDRVGGPGGAEDAYYRSQDPPALAANAPIRRITELQSVRGVEPVMLGRMRPYLDALDGPIAINVNTAPPEVLMAVAGGLDAEGAAILVAARDEAPFTSIADFRARLPRQNLIVDESLIDVRSHWFIVTIEARQGDTLARARALLKRSSTSANAWPEIVWQTIE